MSRARQEPKLPVRLPGPPLQFAVVVAGMYLRYTKLPGERVEAMRPVPDDPRPRFPVVELADARARGWLS